MPDLTELQRLAEGAAQEPWELRHDHDLGPSVWGHGVVAFTNSRRNIDYANMGYIAAMSPDTAKKLIAVALAAQAYVNDELDFAPNDGKRWAALRTALEELK